MPLKRITVFICAIALAGAAQGQEQCPAFHMSLLKAHEGGRVDWRPDGKAIAVDRRNPKTGCFDVYEMDTSGNDLSCLTCNNAKLPRLNKGNPAYYPTGDYIVFQAEKDSHFGHNCGFYTNPGSGEYNDLWGMDLKTGKTMLLYEAPNSISSGVLHPHFSHDGTKLLWSEMYHMAGFSGPFKAGRWSLKMADVARAGDGSLSLKNVRTLFPNKTTGQGMVESHGFTPDDKHIVFSGNLGYPDPVWTRNDLFIANLDGSGKQNLTQRGYNEHGQFSPSGRSIAWMSARWSCSGNEQKGTEFYVMESSGDRVCQLSHFNSPGHPESQQGVTNAGDLSWSPDGTRFVGYSHNRDFSNPDENDWLITFDGAQ